MFKNRIVKSESNVQIQATTKTFFIISIFFFSAIDKERERIFGVCWDAQQLHASRGPTKRSEGKIARQHKCAPRFASVLETARCRILYTTERQIAYTMRFLEFLESKQE